MIKKKYFVNAKLDFQEQELLRSVEDGEWRRVSDFEAQVVLAREAARSTSCAALGRNLLA